MSAVLETSGHDIADALSHFDVGELSEFHSASHGIENANYFVKTHKDGRERKFVLTFVQQPSNAGHLYAPLMEALYRDGLPVAPPLQPDSDPGARILLQQQLTGSHTINPTQRQVEALARFTARMHRCIARSEITLPRYPRTPSWLRETIEPWLPAIAYADRRLLEDTITKVEALHARGDVQDMPVGMIHGDLFRDNVLFNERGLTGVLDFHHAATGYWLFDLAVIANDWCTDSHGRLYPDRTQALLASYHQVRRLTEQEIWFFSGFTLYAALAFWVSRLAVAIPSKTEGRVRTKNPDEFRNIVAQHIRHPFYVDPRMLDLS